ncbi:MAG TPA: endo alpha-1,4 polygalactosaminidase [Terriglobales bacterium]|nr:endo alpha-1,4 polygalactosaminidase [Terriglobales bacterium]
MKPAFVIFGLLLFHLLGVAQEIRSHGHPPPQFASHRPKVWRPPLKTSWQWQLTTPIDEKVSARMYDIDMFDNDASVVASLHRKGRRVVCYIDVGTWENWRPDAKKFPKSVLGEAVSGWPGERWLDIRRIDILGPIMRARMDQCQAKGFDGMEPDNVDGYTNDSGFPLTYNDQIAYNTFIAKETHARGLSVGLKNDLDQITDLLPSFDWALDEQCFQYSECSKLLPFIQADKAVFEVEYFLSTSKFCPEANSLNFNSMKKHLDLGIYRVPCR